MTITTTMKENAVRGIRHRVGTAAPVQAARTAVSTRDDISSWWTRDVRDNALLSGVTGPVAALWRDGVTASLYSIVHLTAGDRA